MLGSGEMKALDIRDNRRVGLLMELVNSMNGFIEPDELLEKFIGTMRRAYGARCFAQLSTHGLGRGEYRIVRLLSQDGRELSDRGGAWSVEDRPIHRGGVFGEMIAGGEAGVWHEVEVKGDAVVGDVLAGYRSAAAVPLFENDVGINWVVLFDTEAGAFGAEDLEDLILLANLVVAMINNLETARKLMRANLEIQAEIEQIVSVQQALLPEELPEIPGLRLAASYKTFDRAGGDMYDIARLGEQMEWGEGEADRRWAFLIGDVSGHGPGAAVVMAMLHAILHAYPRRPGGPAEVLVHANRHLCAKRIEQSFVTAFLAFYDPVTRELTYARAGHEPPILKEFPHQGRAMRLDGVGEVPLGIMPEVRYREAKVSLRAGQTLILYTDGIIEAGRRRGKMFGIEGIEDSLITCSGEAECAIRHITEALARHQGDERPGDDQTIVAVQVV